MLKIEVIKFEAQDVITASTAAPEENKCTCSPNDKHYYFENWSNDSLYYDHGDCTYEGEHNCQKYQVVN